MKRRGSFWQNVPLLADLPAEAVPGSALVELIGYNRVLIEGHLGVTQYGSHRISVKVKFGEICVCGTDLQLAVMSKEQLVIVGLVDSVSVHRRC